MADNENDFFNNIDLDGDFGDFSTEQPQRVDSSSVAPAGYSVPEHFRKRGDRSGSFMQSGNASGNYTGRSASFTPRGSLNAEDLQYDAAQVESANLPPESADSAAAEGSGDKQEDSYTPPMPRTLIESKSLGTRYRTRNRRPMRFVIKASIITGAMALAFVLLCVSIFNIMIGSRIDHIKSGAISTVRLSAAEQEKLALEESAEEVDSIAFTQPDIIYEKRSDVKIILIIGSDVKSAEGTPCTTNAMLLAAIDSKHDSIKLIYLSTDLYVRIPGYLCNTLDKAFYYDTANGDDSLPATMTCIQDNFGVTPDGFIVVDYLAFQTFVERLGGVTLELSGDEAAYMSSHWKYGIFTRFQGGGSYTMSASETLNYIRIKDVGDGYLDRVERQELVFTKLLGSVRELSSLELSALAFDLLPMCPTSLSVSELRGLVSSAHSLLKSEVYWLRAPIEGSWRYGIAQTGNGQKEVLVTSYKFTSEAIQSFLYADNMEYTAYNSVSGVILPDVAPAPEVPEDETAP